MSHESQGKLQEAPAQKTWFESALPDKTTVLAGNQHPRMDLRVNLQLYSFRKDRRADTPVEKFLLVSLDGTNVSPGEMAANQKDKRGFYTETVGLKMWFTDSSGIERCKDSPSSSEEGGSISNSLSYNVGVGFFGETPTGSAGMGISNSISQTLPNFEFFNDSEGTVVVHRSQLRMVSGNAYRRPTDLIHPSLASDLYELSPLAISNFPVISQALFHAPKGMMTRCRLAIEITHRLVQVEKTVTPLGWMAGAKTVGYDDKRRDEMQRVNTGTLLIDIIPVKVTNSWEFEIPFNEV